MDLTYKTEYGILELKPTGELSKEDFETISNEIDSIQQSESGLKGLLITTRDFPGYEKFSDMVAHGEFIKENQDRVKKVAICTDSSVGKLLELIGDSLAKAEVKKFGFDEKDAAEKWILS